MSVTEREKYEIHNGRDKGLDLTSQDVLLEDWVASKKEVAGADVLMCGIWSCHGFVCHIDHGNDYLNHGNRTP